ncbi:MAG: phospholipase domain-containing protein [Burkholderiaceae bacterium]
MCCRPAAAWCMRTARSASPLPTPAPRRRCSRCTRPAPASCRAATPSSRASASGNWAVAAQGDKRYDLSVRGPNGFFRAFRGRVDGAGHAELDLQLDHAPRQEAIALQLRNLGAGAVDVKVLDRYTGNATTLALAAGQVETLRWDLAAVFGWYDLLVTVAQDPHYSTELAGHVETGRPSASDPALGGLRLAKG